MTQEAHVIWHPGTSLTSFRLTLSSAYVVLPLLQAHYLPAVPQACLEHSDLKTFTLSSA